MNFFTADPHFWHQQVISYCQRPFASLDEMHDTLIYYSNSLVRPSDTLYIIGDVSFGSAKQTAAVLARMHGYKILVRGNHDTQHTDARWKQLGFGDVITNTCIHIGGTPVWLSHFPFAGQEHDPRTFKDQLPDDGSLLVHGHVHRSWTHRGRMLNVGVDVWDFSPVSEETVLNALSHTTKIHTPHHLNFP